MLQLPSTDTVRVPLGAGAVAILLPIDSLAWLKAQGAARAVRMDGGEDIGVRARQAMIASLVHTGLRGLEGVAGDDGVAIEGVPAPEQIDRLLKWFPAYEALETEYAGPILEAQAEKNGFAPSLGGSSTPRAAKATVKAVKPRKSRAKSAAGSVRPS